MTKLLKPKRNKEKNIYFIIPLVITPITTRERRRSKLKKVIYCIPIPNATPLLRIHISLKKS